MQHHNEIGANNTFQPLEDSYLFSFFSKPIAVLKPLKVINLRELHEIIISDKYKAITEQARRINDIAKYRRFKAKEFDYVTFNGTFTNRADNDLIEASGLFVIDIDHIGENLQAIFERLKNDADITPKLILVSPSGDGLKIVVRIDKSLIKVDGSKRMGIFWDAANMYFSRHYSDLITPNEKGDFIDGACKDVSRACFICHDANSYLRESEGKVIDQEFIDNYIALPKDDSPTRKRERKTDNKKVSPKTSISDLAKKHLLTSDNHTPQLLSFVGACKSIGIAKETINNYITNFCHIAPDSSKADPQEVEKMIDDIYKRYGTDTDGAITITQIEFAYFILKFKYNKDATAYLPTSLFMDGIRSVLHSAGFAKRSVGDNNFIYIKKNGCIIEETTPQIMQDYVFSLISALNFTYQNESYCIPIETVRDTFLKTMHLVFNDRWANCLPEDKEPILKDTEGEMFFCFQNKFVTVTKQGVEIADWNEKKGFVVWDKQIIQHDFILIQDYEKSVWYQFLNNVCNSDNDRIKTMFSAIGYLMHHYFNESEGQAVILYDEAITDLKKPQGGSGKGLLVNGLKHLRNTAKIDGKHYESSNRFRNCMIRQSTQIGWFDDVKPDFDFTLLFSNLTDGWTIEEKNKPQIIIEPTDSPKTVICSNSTIKGDGSSNKRRRFEIELSNFYSKQIIIGNEKPIEQTHGCIFFSKQWNLNEWNMFFSVMMDAALLFLNTGLVPFKGVNLALNRFRPRVGDDYAEWIESQELKVNQWYNTKDYFTKFLHVYYSESPQKIGQRKFTEYLRDYSEYKQLRFDKKQSNGDTIFSLISI